MLPASTHVLRAAPVTETKHYDVLVIGAGIIGLSAAYHIKEHDPNLSVLVLDRNAAPAQGYTSKSVADIRNTFTSDGRSCK
jgi:glycine/D-amino acid oxidase-like deaminating enzyme